MEDNRRVKQALKNKKMWRACTEVISHPTKAKVALTHLAKKENVKEWNEIINKSKKFARSGSA